MPIWGLKSVANVIASGFEGPQHCDEPWNYTFANGQLVLIHVRGEGRSSVWLPAQVVQATHQKTYPTMTLQYWRVDYVDNGRRCTGDFSPLDGDIKPDCPYVRELIAEELMWPIDDPDRSIAPPQRHAMNTRSRVAC